jgi:hypothetical protein
MDDARTPSTTNNCPNCHAALAPDQRYCLNCGHRLAPPRVDYGHELGLDPPKQEPEKKKSGFDGRGPLMTLAAAAAVLLALGVGVVLGRGKGQSQAPKPQVVTVAGSGAVGGTATGPTAQDVGSISDDWPAGASGYTVEVSSIAKVGATAAAVANAKSAASSKGAPKVGDLDGDHHSGTPKGKYVIYSGRYSTKKQAEAAAKKLKGSFPNTIILHVTPAGSGSGSGGSKSSKNFQSNGSASGNNGSNVNTSALNSIQGKTGAAYVKAANKLPSQVGTGGTPPPKDKKKAGGGSGSVCIGC